METRALIFVISHGISPLSSHVRLWYIHIEGLLRPLKATATRRSCAVSPFDPHDVLNCQIKVKWKEGYYSLKFRDSERYILNTRKAAGSLHPQVPALAGSVPAY
jgi:hypothetical protein